MEAISEVEPNYEPDYEPGTILQLQNLSKHELNGIFVEIESIIVTEQSTRWKCFDISNNSNQPLSIKSVNFKVPEYSSEDIQICDAMLTTAREIMPVVFKTRDTNKMNSSKKILNDVLDIMPNCGEAYNILGNMCHFNRESPTLIIKYMRRAVANHECINNPYEKSRVIKARFSLASTYGEKRDYVNEQYHLHKCLLDVDILDNGKVGILSMLCNSYLEQRKLAESYKFLQEILVNGHDVNFGTFHGLNVNEKVKSLRFRLSYQLYLKSVDLLQMTDKEKAIGSLTSEKIKEDYLKAKELIDAAYDLTPEDMATITKYIEITNRVTGNQNPILSKDGKFLMFMMGGQVAMQNVTEEEVNIDVENIGNGRTFKPK